MAELSGNSEQLKPCPFCGGEARFVSKEIDGGMKTVGWELLTAVRRWTEKGK